MAFESWLLLFLKTSLSGTESIQRQWNVWHSSNHHDLVSEYISPLTENLLQIRTAGFLVLEVRRQSFITTVHRDVDSFPVSTICSNPCQTFKT
jgi:hypothetical protein